MAEGKKSFILYSDLLPTVEKLSDKRAGVLFKTILQYVNDKDPKISDLIVDIVFETVKQSLKRDLKGWEAKRSKKVEAGKLGGIKSGETRRNKANEASASKKEANEPVNVNANVNVNDKEVLPTFSIEHCLVVAMNDDRWVRANKTNKIELEEFNKMLERRGDYTKVPKDYKSHFANWKRAGKKDEPQIQISTNGQSHREEKGKNILESVK